MYARKDGIKITYPIVIDNVRITSTQWIQGKSQEWLDSNGVTLHDDPVIPNYDHLTQSHPVIGDDGEYLPADDLPIEQAKTNKINSINSLKIEKQIAGFEYESMMFDCDEIAIARINATWNFAQVDSNYTQPFILKDNTTVILTNDQCIGLGYACGQFVSGITFTARQLKDAVKAATTVEEVRNVSWPT